MFQVHHQRPQAIAMGDHQDILPLLQQGFYFFFIIRNYSCGCILQALSAGRPDNITSSPDSDLVISILLRYFCFIQSLQLSIIPFIQGLVPGHRQVLMAALFQDQGEGFDSPPELRRVTSGKRDSLQLFSCSPGFIPSQGGEIYVYFTGETILQIPGRLSVPDKD
jgi:hypothetical protein